jgi:hypothetical protein
MPACDATANLHFPKLTIHEVDGAMGRDTASSKKFVEGLKERGIVRRR